MALSNTVIGINDLGSSYLLEVVGTNDVYTLTVTQTNRPDVVLSIDSMTIADQYSVSATAAIVGDTGPVGPVGPQGPEGPQGVPGLNATGGIRYYDHIQVEAIPTWLIPHNLGVYPDVDIIDSDGSIVQAAVKYLDINTVEIDFGVPFSGNAVLRG
jgi:hypothetical protein